MYVMSLDIADINITGAVDRYALRLFELPVAGPESGMGFQQIQILIKFLEPLPF